MSKKKEVSLDQFIEGANEEKEAKRARKRTSSQHILLSATGKVEERSKYNRVLFYLPSDINADMDKFCSGTKQAIMTYLLRRGLDELMKENKIVIYEIS